MKCPFCGGVLPEAPPPSSPKSTAKERITYILKSAPPLSPSEIARLSGLKPGTTRWALRELLAAGDVEKGERGYSLPNARSNERGAGGVGGQTEGGDDVPLLAVKLSTELLEAARDFYERGENV